MVPDMIPPAIGRAPFRAAATEKSVLSTVMPTTDHPMSTPLPATWPTGVAASGPRQPSPNANGVARF